MTVQQLHWLTGYNRWANTRLLQAAEALSSAELERDLGASFGSLQGTLFTCCGASAGGFVSGRLASFCQSTREHTRASFAASAGGP